MKCNGKNSPILPDHKIVITSFLIKQRYFFDFMRNVNTFCRNEFVSILSIKLQSTISIFAFHYIIKNKAHSIIY